jgi:catechol 2,3-dioxygenase-like lactoylglutathione lyase family enzyme
VPATVLNHVSIGARDLEESTRFYEDLLGMKRIPTPNFGGRVQWLRLGTQQLHIAERDQDPGPYNHFGVTVDDFESVYRKAKELGIFENRMQGYHLCELPDGKVQLYLHDPAGNVLEVNHPDVSTLPAEIRSDMTKLVEAFPQSEENLRAKLYATASDVSG